MISLLRPVGKIDGAGWSGIALVQRKSLTIVGMEQMGCLFRKEDRRDACPTNQILNLILVLSHSAMYFSGTGVPPVFHT